MAFAGEFLPKKIESQSRYVVEIEVSFVSTGRDSDKCLAPFWLLQVNIARP